MRMHVCRWQPIGVRYGGRGRTAQAAEACVYVYVWYAQAQCSHNASGHVCCVRAPHQEVGGLVRHVACVVVHGEGLV